MEAADRCRETRAHMSEYLDGELDEQAPPGWSTSCAGAPTAGGMFANLSRTIGALRALRALREVPTLADEPDRPA